MMNTNEIKNFVRDAATRTFLEAFPDALAVNDKPYTFVVPIETEDGVKYAKWGCTCAQMADTKVRPGFNPETDTTPAREAFENLLAIREANKQAKKKEKEKD